MKKFILYSLFFLTVITFTCCGRKDKNENPSPPQPAPSSRTTVTPQIQVSSPASPGDEPKAEPKAELKAEPKAELKMEPETESENKSEPVPAPETTPKNPVESESHADDTSITSGIQINKDGSITIGKDTIDAVLEEEKELLDALNLSDEEMEAITSSESFTITPQLQKKMLEYLDTLPLTEKLRLLGKVTELLEN